MVNRLTGFVLGVMVALACMPAQAQNNWESETDSPEGRSQATVAADHFGRLHIMGGYRAPTAALDTHDIYTPATDVWSVGAPMPTKARGACSATAEDGRIFVFGGFDNTHINTTQIYDPRNDVWSLGTAAPVNHGWYCSAARASDDKIWVSGGEGARNAVSIYNPQTDVWTTGPTIRSPRYAHGSAFLTDGRFYVFGGQGALASTEAYDAIEQQWISAAPMPAGRSHFGYGVIENTIYVVGGSTNGGNGGSPFFKDTYYYDGRVQQWQTGPDDLLVRRAAGSATLGDTLHVVGGNRGFNAPVDNHTRMGPKFLFDTFELKSTSTVYRNAGSSCGSRITPSATVELTHIAAAAELDDDADVKFLVFDHDNGDALILETRPKRFTPNGQTWKLSDGFNLTLVAGNSYDISMTTTLGHRIPYDTTVTNYNSVTSNKDNPNLGDYTNPVINSHGGADCAVRLYGTVNNPPTADAGGPYTVDEGSSVGLQGTGSDPEGSQVSYAWDLDGDNQFDDAFVANPSFQGVDGPATITVSLRVSDGQLTATDTATVTVNNVAPTVGNITPPEPNESAAATFSAPNVSDPAGNNDTLSYLWDFGDNTTSTQVSPTKIYRDNGTYNARLTVTDDDNGSDTQAFTVNVKDVEPTLTPVSGPTSINEGTEGTWSSVLAKANLDAGFYSIVWGDATPNTNGTVGTGVTSRTIQADHTYVDNGNFTIRFRAADDDANTVERLHQVTVRNVAPSIDQASVVPDTGPEGSSFTFEASASDPGQDTLTYAWDFGDNTSGNGTAVTHVYPSDGQYTVQLQVTDDDGGVDTQELTVTVQNAAPVIDDIDYDGRGLEGEAFSFDVVASDPGDDPLTYRWDFGDGDTANGPSVTHTYADDGDYTVTITVRDDAGAEVQETVVVDVGNVAPSLGNVTIPEGTFEAAQAAFNATATDPGADTLTFVWTFAPNQTRTGPDVTFAYPDDGDYLITLVVSDGDGGEDSADFPITILNANPTIENLAGTFSGAEGGDFSFTATASDPGPDTLTFRWDFGDGSDLVQGVDLTQVDHVYGDAGVYTLSLRVTDGDGGQTDVERDVNVGGEGPSINELSGDQLGQEGSSFLFFSQVSEPGGDTITYRWDFGDGTQPLVEEELNEVEHTYAENGTYTLTLTVSDPDGEASATLDVEVQNVPPRVDEFVVPFAVDEGQSFGASASASDPGGNNDPLTFAWDFGDGDTASGAEVTHTYLQQGRYGVQLQVSDDDDGTTVVSQTVIVNNVAPTITVFTVPPTGNEAAQLTFAAAAADPGNDELSYAWNFGNGQSATGATVNPVYPDNGVFDVTLTVSDGTTEVTREAEISINNLAPSVVTLQGRQVGGENQNYPFTALATDPAGDADPLTYRWNFGDGSPEISAVDLTEVNHVYNDAGQYTLRVTVTDGDGGSATRSLVVNVANLPPSIDEFEADEEGNEGDALGFAAVASDPGNDTLTFTWNFGDGSGEVSGIGLGELDHTYADDGEYTVTLTVSDGVAEDSTTTQVVISNVDPALVSFAVPRQGVEGQAATFTARATDPAGDNDPLTYTWDFGDGTEPQTGASVQHIFADDDTYTVTLTVEDDDQGSVQQSDDIAISNRNPAIGAVNGPAEVGEGSEATFFAAAADVEADTLTYAWTFEDGPTVSGVDQTEASHTYPDDGVFDIDLVVTDEDGGRSTASRVLRVRNLDPVIESFTGVFTGAEGDTFNFEAAATDAGDDVLTYRWTFGDGDAVTEGVDRTAVSHQYDAAGQYTVALTVVDDDGGTASISRTVNVGIAAPVIDEFEAPEGGVEGQTLTFTAQASDPVNQELTYIWNFGDGTGTQRGLNLTSVEHTFADDGSFFVQLTVVDPDELDATAGARVIVANAPPVIDEFEVGAFAENQEGTASAEASDPAGDNDPLTYAWDFGDNTPIQAGVDLKTPAHTYASNGDYTLTLTVTDGDGGSVSRTAPVVVGDAAPVILGVDGDTEGNEGDTLQFQVRAVDSGGDALTYSWQVGDNDPVNTDDNPTFRATFADDGTYQIAVTVTDEEQQTVQQTVEVTIANLAPVIQTLTGRDTGNEGQELSFFGLATDAAGDNDPLTYTWSFGDGTDDEIAEGLTSVEHAYADDGEYTVTLTVRDDDGGESSETFAVTVENVAPAILSDPPRLAIVNREYRYPVVVEDPGADTISYELVSGPEGMSFDGSDLTWTLPLEDLDAGPFPVSIRVSDGDGAEDTQAWEIGTDFIDADEDGVPDDCEELYGLDLESDDGDLDNDEDGINNRDECLTGTNPVVFNGPSAPVAESPIEGARVDTPTPDLVVENASDPDNDPLTYAFEVYSDEELEELVTSAEAVAEGDATTAWTVELELTENATFYWRARANDGRADGPWTEPEPFQVDAENSPPTIPIPRSPVGSTDTANPDLVADGSTDPEGDEITYVFELYGDAERTDLIANGEGAEPTLTVETVLEEDRAYTWQVMARDARGAESEWSLPTSFVVNMDNILPSAPSIVAPEDGSQVPDYFVRIEWTAATDLDGDTLTYELQVAEDEEFTQLVHDEDGIPGDGDNNVGVEVGELTEDVGYFVRVRAHDPFGAGNFATSTFTVNGENGPPTAPTLLSPVEGEVVSGGTTDAAVDIELVFTAASDPDGDDVSHTLRVFSDDALADELFAQSDLVDEPEEMITAKWAAPGEGVYYWTVEATDGEATTVSSVESFEVTIEISNAPPSAPLIVSPSGGETLEAPFVLTVENASDPDGDILTYGFEVFSDEAMTQSVFRTIGVEQDASGATSVDIASLDVDDGAQLWWFATVTDGVNDAVQSEVATFNLTATATEPDPGTGCECETPARTAGGSWWRFMLRR